MKAGRKGTIKRVKAQSKHRTAAQEKRARRSGQFTSAFGWIPAGCKPKINGNTFP